MEKQEKDCQSASTDKRLGSKKNDAADPQKGLAATVTQIQFTIGSIITPIGISNNAHEMVLALNDSDFGWRRRAACV